MTQYMYLHLLRKFPTNHQKIDYSSLLVCKCMTKQKSTLSKSRPSCRGTNIWIIIPIVSQTAKQAEWEWEKEIEKGQRESEKTIDIYTCTLIYKYVNQLSLRFNISKIEILCSPFKCLCPIKGISCRKNDSISYPSKICFVFKHNCVLCCVTRTEIDFCIVKIRNVPMQQLHQ